MGRKKKPFIDKKKAVSFNLVHRSQNDPHLDDPGESQMVLASKEDRKSEQKKFGVNYDDDYDYLQHLKAPDTVYSVALGEENKDQKTPLNLPSELFGAKVDSDGLKRVVPLSGPQVDWDPAISEALDRMENDSDCDASLDDDFVLQASGGDVSVPVYCNEVKEISDLEPWWHQRQGIVERSDSSDDGSSALSQSDYEEEREERRTARFTEYSMSSSVVPRSEGLTTLDDRFEEFMIGYDDDQLGPLEEEGEGGDCEVGGEESKGVEDTILNSAVNEFIQKYENTTTSFNICEKGTDISGTCDNSIDYDDNDVMPEEREVVAVAEQQKWDCESILSTYSNLYNHPTLIKDNPRTDSKPRARNSSSDSRSINSIHSSTRTNDASNSLNNISRTVCSTRPHNETKEEQKIRKQAIKQDRKERRQAKKAMKMTFKTEHLRQEKELISNPVLNKIK